MINPDEFRLGNFFLQKINNRISIQRCTLPHFALMETDAAQFYPVVLKTEILEKAGFDENKDYPLLPQAREFRLVLPVNGSHVNEIAAYIKSNGECFARALFDGLPASNPVHHLHQLQNLYHSLTGEELAVRL